MAKILIVEDETVLAWYIQEALENFGHQVVANVTSGEEAIQFASNTQPDLVLMDIRLQGKIDGIAAAEHIRMRFNIPVVYLTAHADDFTLQRAIATNPFGYLVKPFQEIEVHTTIEIALRRHYLEKRLEDRKRWFANTLNSIGDAAIATDCNGNIAFMNPMAEVLTGWSRQEALGKAATTVLKLIHAQTREAIANPLIQAMQNGAALRLPDYCLLLTKDGTQRVIDDTATPLRNSDGEIIGGVLVFKDITWHGLAHLEVQQRKLFLEAIHNVLIAQLRKRTVQTQQAIASIRVLKHVMEQTHNGSNQLQILQTTIQELRHILGADYCWVALYNVNHTLATISCESIAPNKANHYSSMLGTRIDLQSYSHFYHPLFQRECLISPPPESLPTAYQCLLSPESQLLICPLEEEHLVIGEIGFLSAGKPPWSQLEAELASQVVNQCTLALRRSYFYQVAQDHMKELELLNTLKDDFISSVSSELYTPLTNIKMAVEMLQDLVGFLKSTDIQAETPSPRRQLWQKVEQYIRILHEEWQQECDLISDLTNFQHIETLESLSSNPINLQQWLPQMVNCFSKQSVRQEQILHCHVPPNLPPLISHLPSLERIMNELLTSACKYTPPNHSITVTAQAQEEYLAIKVITTGVTIPLEEFNQIFQPFYRIARPNLWNYTGTGLGLALVKKLLQLLSGEIDIENHAEETIFTITLPQKQEL